MSFPVTSIGSCKNMNLEKAQTMHSNKISEDIVIEKHGRTVSRNIYRYHSAVLLVQVLRLKNGNITTDI